MRNAPRATSYSSRRSSRRSVPRKSPLHRQTLRWLLFILLLLTGIFFFTGPRSVFKLYMLYQERENLKRDKQALIQENQQLKEKIKKLESDLEYIEKIAREKYNLKKENEEVYLVEPK
ncbi:MAG: septum formation initiator family protein [Calditrichaeota bacterium]|nr:septum formation initiator family protein [Calditrichota bacterium]